MTRKTATSWVCRLAVLAGGGAMTCATGCQSSNVAASSPIGAPTTPIASASPDLPPVQSAQLCLRAARAFQQQGYDREAIVQLLRAEQFDPTVVPQTARVLAILYGRQGDPARAMAEYDTALRAHPRDAALLNDVGYFELTNRNCAAAEPYLRRAVQVDPHEDRAWINLGLTLGAEKRFDESYAAFAAVLPPAQAKADVGLLLAQQGRYHEADATLRQALSLDPTLAQPQVVLDWVDARLQSPTAAPTPPGGGA